MTTNLPIKYYSIHHRYEKLTFLFTITLYNNEMYHILQTCTFPAHAYKYARKFRESSGAKKASLLSHPLRKRKLPLFPAVYIREKQTSDGGAEAPAKNRDATRAISFPLFLLVIFPDRALARQKFARYASAEVHSRVRRRALKTRRNFQLRVVEGRDDLARPRVAPLCALQLLLVL